MHKHDEHTVHCDQYVPKSREIPSRSKTAYSSRQWHIGVVTGQIVTDYKFPIFTNRLFWQSGKDDPAVELRARTHAECTGGQYRRETRATGQVFHTVRFRYPTT